MKKELKNKQINEIKDMLINKYMEIRDKYMKGEELNFAEIEYIKALNKVCKESNNEK